MVFLVFLQESIGSREVVRDDAFRADYFFDALTRIRRDLAGHTEYVVAGADHRFRQVRGVLNHRHPRHSVAVPDEVLGNHGAVAAGDAVAANPALLEMVGGDSQDIALPLTRRKAHGSVWSIIGRVWPPVHP